MNSGGRDDRSTSYRAICSPWVSRVSVVAMFVLVALMGVPDAAVADAIQCESHSLSRGDQARVKDVARTSLPRSVPLLISAACWNPRGALAAVQTRKTIAAGGVEQWSQVLCRREELDWQCDPAEFKQLIKRSLLIGDEAHEVELTFDKDSAPERALMLAARALTIYADRNSRLPGCEISAPKDRGLVDVRRANELPPVGQPTHLTLSRDGVIESVFLDDVSVVIEFPAESDGATKPQASCWNDSIVVS
jgi:hypothetical protein